MFKCPNVECAIHIKGKEFPAMMDCPLCDTPLENCSTLGDSEQKMINSLPYVIAYPYKRMLFETDARNKLELLAYTFLNGLKLLGLELATEYFYSNHKSARINELFRNNLFQPSYGNWNNFLREISLYFEKENAALVFPEFMKAYATIELDKKAKKYKTETPYTNDEGHTSWKKSELTAIGTLINFRNRYLGHGTPLLKEEYKALFEEIIPVFNDFIDQLSFMEAFKIIKYDQTKAFLLKGVEVTAILMDSDIIKQNEGLIKLESDDRTLNLLPFFIMPKRFMSGVDARAEVMIYEQNTGQRVVFFSPESIKAEESGQVLDRIKLLLLEKEKALPCAIQDFNLNYLSDWASVHNEKTIEGLRKEKKIIDGIYQNRREIESSLSGWWGAKAGLYMIAAEAGSGKTNLLTYMLGYYQKLNLKTILIRANRFESDDFEFILRSIFNAPTEINFIDFISRQFTQHNPLVILIDGGNEHAKPKSFIDKIIALLIKIPDGQLKVVLSWRINHLKDLPTISLENKDLIYNAETHDIETLPGKYAYQLKGLDKIELECAWKAYTTIKNLECRPQFSFSDLLLNDPKILEELSNPLLLRLFLELFHQKKLPKSTKGFINLWEVWWNKMKNNTGEADYLLQLARYMMWQKKLTVSLDELFDQPELSVSVKNIEIDSPHQQLLRKGIISQYFQNDSLQISFTMEASLYYVASLDIQSSTIKDLILEHPIWNEPVKYYLWQHAAVEENEILFDLIDDENFPSSLTTIGLAQYIIIHGTAIGLKKLLKTPSDSDWKILRLTYDYLVCMRPSEKEKIANEILSFINDKIDSQNIYLALHLLSDACKFSADESYTRISSLNLKNDFDSYLSIAKYHSKYGKHLLAKKYLIESLQLAKDVNAKITDIIKELINVCLELSQLKETWEFIEQLEQSFKINNELTPLNLAKIYSEKAKVKEHLGEYKEAGYLYQKALEINKSISGEYHKETISNLEDLGDIENHQANYDKALEIYRQVLQRYQTIYGESHPNVATSYNRIGAIYDTKGNYDLALEYFKKNLKTNLEYYGESHPNVASSYSWIGDIYYTKGNYDLALEYFEKDLKISIEYYGESHPNVAASYNSIGDIYNTKGNYDQALEYFEKDLKISIEYYGESHPNVAASYNSIGDIYNKKGNYDLALEYFEKCLNIRLEYYGESHPNVAASYNRIGGIFNTKGNYDLALEYFEKDLKISIEYYSESHPNVAASYNSIGGIYNTKGNYDQALEYFEKQLNINLEYYGESHPNVAASFSWIGDVYNTKGNYDLALEYFEKGLKISIEYYGESHPNVAAFYNSIGGIYNTKGNYDLALEYFNRVLKINMKYFGDSHPEVAFSYMLIGDIYNTKGNYDLALEYFEKDLKISIEYYGESHPNVASSYNRIGGIYNTRGNFNLAFKYFERVLKISIEYYGESHPNVAASYSWIGEFYNTKGNYDLALEYFKKNLNINLEYYGESHPNVAASYSWIGGIYNAKGNYDIALEYFKKTLNINLEYYGESHPNVAASYNRIGGIYNTKGNYDLALEYFEKDLKISIEYYGESHPNVAASYGWLGDIYDTKGNYDLALEYFEKNLKINLEYYGELHPNVAASYNLIGDIYNTKGNYDLALEYFEKNLKINLEYYGESHPNLASSYGRIGEIYNTKGKYILALEYFKKCLKIRLDCYGEEHPNVATSYLLIGRIMISEEKYDLALNNLKIAQDQFIKFKGERHLNTGVTKRYIGKALVGKEDYDTAEKYINESIDILSNTQIKNDSRLAHAYVCLSQIQRHKKQYNLAFKSIEKAISIFSNDVGENHINNADAFFEKGMILFDSNNYQSAFEWLNKCHFIRHEKLGEKHPDTIQVHDMLNKVKMR
jgi:tetratricopeptide (TPR) repeat protein